MRNGIIIIGTAFAVTLAIVITNRLSSEAMAVAVGAACGIAASIPVSIGLVIAASHNWGRTEMPRQEYQFPARPYAPQQPIIIISPPQQNQTPHQYPAMPYYFPSQPNDTSVGPREFKIIGEE